MRHRFYTIYSSQWVQIIFLIGFCFVLYFLNLNQWELRKPDEIRYAQVAREMVEGGDWILMHLHGRPYMEKPPLFFWLIALSSYLWQGFTSFSARFPSAFFGTFTVLITFFIGKNLYDSRTGFLSGLILATSFFFARFSTRANIDATLTFFITASLFCFLQWYRWDREGSDRQMDIRRLSIYGFYVGMGLATLTKGPVGLFLPLLASLFYLLIQKDWRGIKGMRILSGMILFLAIVLSWYIPAILKGGEAYLNETLFHQTIDYYSKGWDHPKPIYFYLRNFPVDFLPWVLFFPGAMVYGYSKEACGKRKEFLFLLTWFIVIFLFFSFSKTKRDLYLLPLYPAASLMIGKFWGDFIFEQIEHFRKEWISLPLYGFMGLSLAMGLIIFWVISKKFPSYLLYTLPITCFLVGGSIVLFFLYRFKKYGIIFFLSILMAAGGFFYIENILFPLEKRLKPTRSISYEMKKEISLISP